MHARVPVEAAVEQRVQRLRSEHILRPAHHVIELVRIFPRHVRQREPGERGRDLGRERRGYIHGGAHRRNTSRYMSSVFVARSRSAVGTWALITAYSSFSYRRAAGTVL